VGGVVDRYVQYQAAGDQLCGRTVAGLYINSYKFGVTRPFFDPSLPGPDPTDDDCGRILLDQGDTNSLGNQGQMLMGSTATEYLNLLVHKYHDSK
jgi:hypothetical protein